MQIYQGHSLGPGVAIAAAARLEETFGVPQLSPERQRRMGETLLRAGLDLPDPDQIIIVARRIPPGFLASSFPGLEIVGAALGDDAPLSPPPPCPVVAHAGDDLWADTEEGDIVIIDGDRGRIYVSPDAQTLARYQGPGRRARRFFLEPAHVEARRGGTGIAIPVLAAAADWDNVQAAMEAGADGVLIPQDGTIWGHDDFLTASEQLLRLRDIGAMTGGKTLFLQAPLERVALSALAQAASWGPVHLVLDTLALAGEARAEMDDLETELDEEDIAYGRVALTVLLGTDETPTPEALLAADGLLVAAPWEAPLSPSPPWKLDDEGQLRGAGKQSFSPLAEDAEENVALSAPPEWGAGGLPFPRPFPVTAFVSDPDEVSALLDAGVTRLLTSISQVQAVKDAVRRS